MIVKRFNFEIFLEAEKIVASSIRPLRWPDGKIDDAAKADFDEFVMNIFAILDENGFEILDIKESKRSETSYYFTTYNKAESTEESVKAVIFIRISDHSLNEAESRVRARKSYYQQQAEFLKKPESKRRQFWKFKNIVVNDNTFDSYDDALNFFSEKLKSW